MYSKNFPHKRYRITTDFINKNIDFIDIYDVIQRTFDCFSCSKVSTIDEIFEYDKEARIQAEKVIKSLH